MDIQGGLIFTTDSFPTFQTVSFPFSSDIPNQTLISTEFKVLRMNMACVLYRTQTTQTNIVQSIVLQAVESKFPS